MKKNHTYIYFFGLCLIGFSVLANPQVSFWEYVTDLGKEILSIENPKTIERDLENYSPNSNSKKIRSDRETYFSFEGISLNFPLGSLKRDVRISVKKLSLKEIKELPHSISVVTPHSEAYRFRPKGLHLAKETLVELSYDKTKIPEGYEEDDISIFYYDIEGQHWKKLDTKSIDKKQQKVQANTQYLSDFIAGIIKLPESPDTSGFTPTQISGLKASEPFVGIENIATPTPNSQGMASTSFPLHLPKGRNGMEPSLQIVYQQDGGHTWLGQGWNLSLPSINIDTRWGVPRYDNHKETETYLLAGEELLPNAHRQDWENRSSNKRFFPRKESGFSKIIREGNSPKHYTWRVHSKSGTMAHYGGSNAHLTDHNGNIGYWAISKQTDLNGNKITYEYQQNNGILYPKAIYYTGYQGNKGKYSVHFFTDKDLGESERADTQINARLGFKQNFNRLLRKIVVRYGESIVRSYELIYTEGAYRKTLLKSITAYDSKGKDFYTHEFSYYDDVRDSSGNYQPFGVFQKWEVPNDHLVNESFLGIKNFSGQPTLTGTSKSETKGVNFRLGVGTSDGKFKENTIGGHGGTSWGTTRSKLLFQDIDGDNLPDKVFIKGKEIYYYKNLFATGKNGFSKEKISIKLPNLGLTKVNSFNYGVDLQLKGQIGANIGYNKQTSKSRTDSYFMDFNGDGLVDFASNGLVYYNRLKNGIPHFEPSSTATPSPIKISGTSLDLKGNTSIDRDSLIRLNPLHDVVKTWRMPYSGTIKVEHLYQLKENTSNDRNHYKKNDNSPKADGVALYFQHQNQLIWKEFITENDYSTKQKNNELEVQKGDVLYFRVSSIYDGNYDSTSWTQNISYTHLAPTTDQNGLDLKRYSSPSDVLFSAINGTEIAEAISPNLKGIFKKGITTDKVIIKFLKYSLQTGQSVLVSEKTLGDEATEFDISQIHLGQFSAGDRLLINIESPTEIHWKNIDFSPKLSYQSPQSGAMIEIPLEVDWGIFNKIDAHYLPQFLTPSQKGKLRLTLDFSDVSYFLNQHKNLNSELLLTAKQNGRVVARTKYEFSNQSIKHFISDDIAKDSIEAQKPLFLEMSIWDKNGKQSVFKALEKESIGIIAQIKDSIKIPKEDPRYPDEKYEIKTTLQKQTQYAVYEPFQEPYTSTLFGREYRGWGSFILNGTKAGDIINPALLQDHKGNYQDSEDGKPSIDENDPKLDSNSGMEVSDAYFIRSQTSYAQRKHLGLEEDIFISDDLFSPSRLGENDLESYLDNSLPTLQGGNSPALAMINESKSHAVSFGAGVLGASRSWGTATVTQTMSDFNGDRFPDFVRGGSIQFTEPKGGISAQKLSIGRFSYSKTSSQGGSVNGGFNHGEPKGSLVSVVKKQDGEKQKIAIVGAKDSEKVENSLSISANLSTGEDHAEYTHTDINGDGLADRISEHSIRYNLGYTFSPEESFNFGTINQGSSSDTSAGLGYSAFGGSFSGGINYTRSTTQMNTQMMDMTGDGLADKIIYTNDNILIYQNLGNSWDTTPFVFPKSNRMAENVSVSYGGGANFTIPINLVFIKIAISFGGSYGQNINRSEASFTDVNGDGHLDYVLSEDEDDLRVALSTYGRTNLLKSIKNATGSRIDLDYEWKAPTYDNPNSQWVLKEVKLFDGHTGDGEDYNISRFSYENPYYDRWERSFYGYEIIKQEAINPKDNSVLRSSVQEFYNQDFYRNGLIKSTYTLDENGQKLSETTTEYCILKLKPETAKLEIKNPISGQWLLDNRISPEAHSLFIAPIKTTEKSFEGNNFLEHISLKSYDENGNLAFYTDKGNGSAQSEMTAEITYHENQTPYFGGVAKSIIVKNQNQVLRHRTTDINPQTAEVVKISQYADLQTASVTDLTYDQYGNLTEIKGAENYKGERTQHRYTYDDQTHSHLVKTTDQFGYENTTAYDYRFNVPTQITDRNGETISYTYDAKGRLRTILAPKEAKVGKPYTIKYEYPDIVPPLGDRGLVYALTKNHDSEHNKDIETYTYADGLGRVVQIKKTASIFKGKGIEDELKHIVSGKQIYDALGRVTEIYQPTTAPISKEFVPSANSQSLMANRYEYDSKDRIIKQIFADNTEQNFKYEIFNHQISNANSQLKLTQTDALGRVTKSFTDILGRQTSIIQANGTETSFNYNAIGELTEVKDAKGNLTLSEYDLLGRRTKFTHPDAGTTLLTYDKASNLIKRQTSQIREEMPEASIEYHYDFTRLKEIKYPKFPDNNVRYHYGSQKENPSRRGRLWLVEDASGGVEYFYGNMGEVEKEIRSLRISPTEVHTYITEYQYDSWNRIQKMVYPDGETLDYQYNQAGKLNAISPLTPKGGKHTNSTGMGLILQQGYDEFEQKVYRRLGNGTETTYTYEPVMRRLSALKTSPPAPKGGTSQLIQNNLYQYDLVGNILSVDNSLPQTPPLGAGGLGGNSFYQYQYDELNRLINAKGRYQGAKAQANYELNMSYNELNGITQKALNHQLNGQEKGYTLNYEYKDKNHPNAPSFISGTSPFGGEGAGRSYQYDANGNPTHYEEFKGFRSMLWDEENRLRGINDNGKLHLYTYDHTGERAVKSTSESSLATINGASVAVITHNEDYTAYVSPYFVVQKGRFTKHYFEGSARIVSKLGEGTFTQPSRITAGAIDYVKQSAQQQQYRDNYIRGLKVPPGPPTQHGIYATPEWTGKPYPSIDWESISQDQTPPEGWPRPPKFNDKGDVPGPPVQYGEAITNANAKAGFNFVDNGVPERNVYFYHPDHLGSSSYITDLEGNITQHTEYMAFGEILYDEHSVSITQPYLFNGKELDQETGLYYYGARYYDPKVSIFLNVDPLVEKTMTPYAYVNNNPINLIDPTGMESEEPPIKGIDFFSDNTGNYFWNVQKNKYEHYKKGKDGRTYFEGYYTPSEKKGPIGKYTIIHNREEGELAFRDIVKEINYTDVSKEDVTRSITLEYSSRDIEKSEIFVRKKGSKNERILLNTEKTKRTMADHISGLSKEINIYSETRKYGDPNINKKRESSNSANIEVIKNIIDIVIDIVSKGKKR